MPKKWTEDAFEVKTSTIEGAGRACSPRSKSPKRTRSDITPARSSTTKILSRDRPFNAYILWVCKTHIIDGEGEGSNYTRYINHSNEPNAFLVVSSRWKTARFEALRTIEPGEEIFFDYGDDYWGDQLRDSELPEWQ